MYKKTGFTLIELGITLFLFVIVMTLTLANVSFLNKSIVSSEIDKLYSICRYLQRCAILSNQKQELIFDTKNGKYSFNNNVQELPMGVKFCVNPQVKGPPSKPKNPISSPITFKLSRIIFQPDGIIQPGTVYLTDVKERCIYALSSSVAHISYLRRYTYDGKWTALS